MILKLFALFTIAPIVELAVLIYAGKRIGIANTLSIVIITALAGSIMVRREGLSVISRFRMSLSEGRFPSEEILDGAMIVVAGALLLTPGFVTDIIGFSLVVPAGRELIKPPIKRFVREKFIIIPPGPKNPY